MSARKSERLLNLLITLLVTRGYVTKGRLREVIPDYREARSTEAFEKMFERDKDELRSLGIPVDVGGHDSLFGDEPGYTVKRSEFELPDISLSPDEAAVVGLAARVWQHAGLASATSDALRKLSAAGVEVDREALDVVQPRLSAHEPSFGTFWEAVSTRRPVTFGYLASGAPESTTRRLEPWGIVSYRSRWYVVGHDRDREGTRAFRLSRVRGTVRFIGPPGSVAVPDDVDLRRLAGRLAPASPDRTAVLRAREGRALALRRRATSTERAGEGWDRVRVPFASSDALADEVAGYAADVVVEQPDDVRALVLQRLRAVAEAG